MVPNMKTLFACEDCVSAVLKDSIQTSLVNRTSIGYLLGLPVDMDSIVVNGIFFCILHLSVIENQCFFCGQEGAGTHNN